MNGRLVAFDMAGNSIVFDIAEEVLPNPTRWRESLLGLFLSILWDKIKTHIHSPHHILLLPSSSLPIGCPVTERMLLAREP